MQSMTFEQLQVRNRALRAALEKAQTTAHYALMDAGAFDHRGSFHNCPAPECYEVRVLLGKEIDNGHQA